MNGWMGGWIGLVDTWMESCICGQDTLDAQVDTVAMWMIELTVNGWLIEKQDEQKN